VSLLSELTPFFQGSDAVSRDAAEVTDRLERAPPPCRSLPTAINSITIAGERTVATSRGWRVAAPHLGGCEVVAKAVGDEVGIGIDPTLRRADCVAAVPTKLFDIDDEVVNARVAASLDEMTPSAAR
jgi:hypothetical protein